MNSRDEQLRSTPVSPLRVLLAGEPSVGSAPIRTLAAGLATRGMAPITSGMAEAVSAGTWLRLVRNSDVIVFVGYHGPDIFLTRQFALAASLGRPLVRWWVGSDVWHCSQDNGARRRARLLDSFCACNIAVAPHLAQELSSLGIHAHVIPSPIAAPPSTARAVMHTGAVLVYLPGSRKEFYRIDLIHRTILANPDVHFVIVGDDTHQLAGISNVESLGWVEQIEPIYDRVGCVLRMTQHDGLPRMVLEALLRGKYVIYSGELPGCWQAATFDDIHRHLAAFRNIREPNEVGRAAIQQFLEPPPEARFCAILTQIVTARQLRRQIRAAVTAATLALFCRVIR